MRIQHIGLVVSNLDETLSALGLSRADVTESVHDPVQDNTLHFVHLPENNLWLEFVEPMSERASTAKFAAKFGMGLHHLGFDSDDLVASEQLHASREGAFTLGRYQIEVRSFGGRIRTLFVAVRGLILEYVRRDD
jgi:catechol 2,3-dioxygenase-like lactoylglutathione lyase family enzyme